MTALMLAALDQTIVATSLPRIVADLGGSGCTPGPSPRTCSPDGLGAALRKARRPLRLAPLFLIAIVIFLIGSAFCGLALGDARAGRVPLRPGLGAGGLIPLAMATVGMIVPPRRGRYQGLIGGTFAAASLAGPAIGGFIVDNTTLALDLLHQPPCGLRPRVLVISLTMPRRARAARALDRLARRRPARRRHRLAAARPDLGRPRVPVGLAAGDRRASRPRSCSWPVSLFVERRVREPILPFDALRTRSCARAWSACRWWGWRCSGRSFTSRCSCRA